METLGEILRQYAGKDIETDEFNSETGEIYLIIPNVSRELEKRELKDKIRLFLYDNKFTQKRDDKGEFSFVKNKNVVSVAFVYTRQNNSVTVTSGCYQI